MSRKQPTTPQRTLKPDPAVDRSAAITGADISLPDGLPAVMPLVVKPKAACQMLSSGLTRLYELIAAGELTSYTDGRSRLITTDSIRAYVARKIATGGRP